METIKKIKYIREEMQANKIAACIIPSADPHLSEYLAAHWKLREYLSGFTGSNGTLVITAECACLWTDSRYYLQSEKELNTELFTIQREGETETPTIVEWLKTNLQVGETIGIDGSLFAASTLRDWNEEFKRNGIHLQTNFQTALIQNLPPLPNKKAFLLDSSYCGESASSKINRICNANRCDYTLLTALDEVAWTFNIRGNDIDYNPMVIAYACIGKEKSTLFITDSKLDKSIRESLNNNNISILPYEEIGNFIRFLNKNQYTISVDAEKTNYALYSLINEQLRRDEKSIVALFKAQKNETEINNLRKALQMDGVALCRALSKIEEKITKKETLTEYEVGEIIHEERAQFPEFHCDSFAPIVGFGANGAIVHYSAKKDEATSITSDNLLLIDSGGNYLCGTTDITRTFCFGEASAQQKRDYTLVLKGHIALARQAFPTGTCGEQLDILARQFLWNDNLNYGHGTGHGIGHFLCVHEGPQSIRPQAKGVALLPGMLLSDEPGLYRTNEYGIRIENMVCVTPAISKNKGEFLTFETLTLFPYETKLIDFSLLTPSEVEWINNYHQHVFDELSPWIEGEKSYEWLKNITKRVLY